MSPTPIEAATSRRIWIRLLPFLFVLYVINFLDRTNIGFAALTMNKELAITSQQFGLVVGVFFIGYFILEIPSNLTLHRIGARVWIARILITWGLVAVAMGFVRNVGQLYLARFVLGLAEAGFFPGIVLYLTYWFPQREQARTIAMFLTAQPIASILGGPVSGSILDRAHWLGLSSWRWLLVLEGLPAVLAGVLTYFVLPNRPADATFLTAGEKGKIAEELESERREKERTRRVSALETLTHPRVWQLAIIGMTHAIGVYTLNFWLPQTVKSLFSGAPNTTIGFIVAVPYAVALVAMILTSRHSDRVRERRYHLAIALAAAGSAFIALRTTTSPAFSIALLSIVAAGAYSFFGPYFASASAFLTGYASATGIALITSVANLGGFIGPYVVGFVTRQTGSLQSGMLVAGASLLVSAALATRLPRRLTA